MVLPSFFGYHRSMVGKEGRFAPLEPFLLRFPLLPFEQFADFDGSDPLVQEAIALASPSLASARTPKAEAARARYLSRMTTRPTPFGLFAGVSLGRFGPTDLRLAPRSEHRKRTRPDLKWLLGVVRDLERDPNIVRQLSVFRNSAVWKAGNRLQLLFAPEWGQQCQAKGRVSIRATEVALTALHLAEQPIPFERLVRMVSEQYGASPEKSFAFLFRLFQEEFLLSTLRPPLTDKPLDHVIEGLSHIEGAEATRERLLDLRSRLEAFDQRPLGESRENREGKEGEECGIPLQVDLRIETRAARLSPQVGVEAARAAECLWRLSPAQLEPSHLRSYRMEFLEKYGKREVPLLQVLEELGPPATYAHPPSHREAAPPRFPEQRQTMLLERLLQAVRKGEREVLLTEELLGRMEETGETSKHEAPESLELYAEVVAASPEAVDAGDFLLVLGPNPGTGSAGLTFGRFFDLLPFDFGPPPEGTVRLSFLPPDGKCGNVVITPCRESHDLALGTTPAASSLALDDILVGADSERFTLRSRTLGEVRFRTGHLLNAKHSPNVVRFLLEVSHAGARGWTPFQWGPLERSPFLPRVRYGRTILSPATWRFEDPDGDWEAAFARWRREWEVPPLVFLGEGDQRILLDLDRPEFRKEAERAFSRDGKLVLREMISRPWAEGPEGHYCFEAVFPLKRTTPRIQKPFPRFSSCSDARENRLKLPGSDWLYLKFYHSLEREQEWLLHHLAPFAERQVEAGRAQAWFFLRYQDPEPHLRLRFRGEPSALLSMLPDLHGWAQEGIEDGTLFRFSIESYDRELERYQRIEAAEVAFSADSRTVVRLLSLDAPLFPLAARSLLDLMEAFGLSTDEQRTLLPRGKAERGVEMPDGSEIEEAFALRRPAVRRLGEETDRDPQVLRSLLHLHCNRLLGRERASEERALVLARRLLEIAHHRNPLSRHE